MPDVEKSLKGFADFCHNNMEQAGKEEEKNLEQQKAIKDYLLGALSDKAKRQVIEEKILLDDDFGERVLIAEDELIDKYLDDNLDDSEKRRFVQFFLKPEERKQKFRLNQNLRKVAMKSKTQKVWQFPKKKGSWFDWRGLFSSPVFRFATVILLIFGVGFGVWILQRRHQPDFEEAYALIRAANSGNRLFESRITVMPEYVPMPNTRGENTKTVADQTALDRARELIFGASASGEGYHARGLLYLTEKNFDEALRNFNLALKLTPNNARLHNDIGALYLEKAKIAQADKNGQAFAENANSSREHLERAIELDENLLEALFNKALILQMLSLSGQARETWEKYLERDSNSAWANEARRQIQKLDSQKSQKSLSADEVEKAFLIASRQKNAAEASKLINQNRELVTRKYLPQKLAMSFIEASGDEKSEYLKALHYAGELEEKNIGDLFAKDLAAFYAKASEANLELIKQAQTAMRNSYELYHAEKNNEGLEEAKNAQKLFLQAGDVYEAKLSEFLIIYFLIKSKNGTKDSIPPAESLANFCLQNNYKWLRVHTLYWLGGAQRSTGDRANANVSYKNCLALAREINDSQILQKILLSLAKQNNFVGQYRLAFNYLEEAFSALANTEDVSLREKMRSYSDSIEIFVSLRLYKLAKDISLENIRLARDLGVSFYIANSKLDSGIVHAQAGDFEEARKLLAEAKQNTETNIEDADRTELLAKSLITLGYLEGKLNNHSQAAKFYDEALSAVENNATPFFLYEIQKGRLLTDIALNKEVEEQINTTIDLAEKYRREILSDQARNSFFNIHQGIYDIAVDNDFKHARYEQGYDYLEKSNARSLLDWLKKGVNVKEEKDEIEINFNATTEPLKLNEIRVQMPERVQILQYAVLEKKVLIWLVSKDNFTVVSSDIESEKLSEKVEEYIQLVSAQDDKKQEEAKVLARELYNLLIAPIASQLDPTREICVIPQKILFHLPFAGLISPDGKPFLAQFNYFLASSANVFLLSTEIAKQKSTLTNELLLSVGNPNFNTQEFKNLQDLPDAENEVREITRYYPPQSQKLIGREATKKALESLLKNAEIFHFAGHYIVRHGEPLNSGLLLTQTENSDDAENSILTNAELIRLKLSQLKLVVLPACQTGVEQYYNGEGLVGLSRTFLAAGAPLVVASQWKVDSSAAAELMKRFHFLRKQEKLSTTAALRRAQLEMMEAPDGSYRQPYFWAAFAAYGGYAEF